MADAKKSDDEIKQNGMPTFKLNIADRFFLAVTKKSVRGLVFVYTLGCNAAEGNRYNAIANIEIAAFDNPKNAEIYYQTILEFIQFFKGAKVYDALADFNENALQNFLQKVK